MAKSKKNKNKAKLNLTVRHEQRNKLEQMASLENRSLSNLIEVMADERWKRLAEEQGVAYAKTVAEAMNLKLDADNPADLREIAPSSSRSRRREKNAKSKKAPSLVVDCYFHHRMNFPSSAHCARRTFHDLLKSPWCAYVLVTVLDSSNTRMIALCESDHEQYFAYATALRTASGPVYQIGPYGSRSLIRSKPSWSSRGRIS
jgi:hypothetical protein